MTSPRTPRPSAARNEPRFASRRRERLRVVAVEPAHRLERVARDRRSSTASGPTCATVPPEMSPERLTRPHVGLMPNTPLIADGMRIDPPPSAPSANGTSPVATATPEPVDEPPARRSSPCGFRGIARFEFAPFGVIPNSVIGVVPIVIAPAARMRATLVPSRGCAARVDERGPALARQAPHRRLLLHGPGHAVERTERLALAPAPLGVGGLGERGLVGVVEDRTDARRQRGEPAGLGERLR